MAIVKGEQLTLVQRLYRFATQGLSGITEVDTDHVSQVLPIVPEILRRSMTVTSSQGVGVALFKNEHAGAGQLTTTINPYTTDNVGNGYPSPVDFTRNDVWIIGASVDRTAGAGTLDAALLEIQFSSDQGFFGEHDDGSSKVGGADMPVARWDSIDTTTNRGNALTEQGQPYVPINLRLARGTVIAFISDVAGASADIQCNLIVGLFPQGMGQDIAT